MPRPATIGSERLPDEQGRTCKAFEIEPGRPVRNDWDRALFETWAERKARLATERATQRADGRS